LGTKNGEKKEKSFHHLRGEFVGGPKMGTKNEHASRKDPMTVQTPQVYKNPAPGYHTNPTPAGSKAQ